jgi:hypothetical protein
VECLLLVAVVGLAVWGIAGLPKYLQRRRDGYDQQSVDRALKALGGYGALDRQQAVNLLAAWKGNNRLKPADREQVLKQFPDTPAERADP